MEQDLFPLHWDLHWVSCLFHVWNIFYLFIPRVELLASMVPLDGYVFLAIVLILNHIPGVCQSVSSPLLFLLVTLTHVSFDAASELTAAAVILQVCLLFESCPPNF